MSVAMTRSATLASGFLRFLFRPPVRCAFFVSRAAAFGGDFTLLLTVHHSEASSCLGHDASIGL